MFNISYKNIILYHIFIHKKIFKYIYTNMYNVFYIFFCFLGHSGLLQFQLILSIRHGQ